MNRVCRYEAPMPTARRGLGLAAAANVKLYAVGGANAGPGFFQPILD